MGICLKELFFTIFFKLADFMNIVLIGFRGTGKTSIGMVLAKKLKMEFADSDDLIVKLAGKSIPEIFEIDGEKKFREFEAKAIEELSKKDNTAIATGGGVPCNEKSIELLKKNGLVFLLQASPEILLKRIQSDSNRPALTGKKNKLEEILHLLQERKDCYEKAADYRILSEKVSVEETAVEIIELVKKHKSLMH